MRLSAARLAAESLRALPRTRLSRAMGRLADLKGPRPLVERAIEAFTRYYGIDMSEALIPADGFSSFDAFFTRKLKPGVRPLDPDPEAILSPADGRLDDVGPIATDASLRIKGRTYGVQELLADPALAARYEGGHYFIVYLSPRDYHRVHAPVSGRIVESRYIPGTLYPVNEIGTEYIDRLFARNERVSITQESEQHGTVTSVMVGAIGVGRISLSFDDLQTNLGYRPGVRHYGPSVAGATSPGSTAPSLDRGEELGVFHLGSTVIVFVSAACRLDLVAHPGDVVRMGRALAHGAAR